MEDLFPQSLPVPEGPAKKKEEPKETLADIARRVLSGKGGSDTVPGRGDAFAKFKAASAGAGNSGIVSNHAVPRAETKNVVVAPKSTSLTELANRLPELTAEEIEERNRRMGEA